MAKNKDIVKLHFELADPTQLQLFGVRVDFIFHCHKNKDNKKETHLTSIRRKGQTCLISGRYLMDV